MRWVLAALALAIGSQVQAYGYDDDYDYVETVSCSSKKGRTSYCEIDTRYGVQLVDQRSRTPCIEGDTWGYDRRGVWVSGGCRGEFQANPPPRQTRGRDYGRGNQYSQQVLIACESYDHEPTYCSVPTRGRVVLVNQLSRSSCREGRDWGYDRRGVWVANGCRAEFAVQ
jgi:hypothetical protein